MFNNQNDPAKKLHPPRAKSHRLDDDNYIVDYRGATYIVNRFSKENPPWWQIRHRGTRKVLHVIQEQEGWGKEEPIAWIESFC